jgi:hypothetical protein
MTEREQERAAVVAWLRNTAEGFHVDWKSGLWEGDEQYPQHAADILDTMADAIERGEHVGKE